MRRRSLLPVLATTPLAACSPAADTPATATATATDPQSLIATIAEAAEARDYVTLSAHMADKFSYSFGREPSREGALTRYREQPELLDELARVLDQECAPKIAGTGHWFVCPAAAADERQAYHGWRAGFRQKQDGSWEFVWFIAGD